MADLSDLKDVKRIWSLAQPATERGCDGQCPAYLDQQETRYFCQQPPGHEGLHHSYGSTFIWDEPLPAEPAAPRAPEMPASFVGYLTLRTLQSTNAMRAGRWHKGGLTDWSPLEWAGAMAGEAGEACNAAKKLKRIEDGIGNLNEPGRSLVDREEASIAIAEEVADTIIYGVLLAERVGVDIEEAVRLKFNRTSEKYGFPERLPDAELKAQEPAPDPTAALRALVEQMRDEARKDTVYCQEGRDWRRDVRAIWADKFAALLRPSTEPT